MSEQTAIQVAVSVAGGQSALARVLACTPQHVQKMCATGHVPASRVLKIELATGVSRHLLRPDLYPESFHAMDQTIPVGRHASKSPDPAGFSSSNSR